ncbi:restriction endonuclease subunit S [Ferrimonas balearica]|uniref:restriction endonuclease subunit S n=1 Tax=Ferrimonas balearica TaxID=44012 RepID=UPI002D80FF17|nr:restriction endonuclease subunit S [Ferrimonas balearica]MBY6093969.1 restriction endonuclease subunit S [Ferrimonas balearica]
MSWPLVKLKEVATLINGRAYKKHELLDSGKYTVLRVGNFFSNRGWYYSDLELQDKHYCDNGDLLYAWSASFGPRIWEGGKVIYHYHIWKLELDETRVHKKYLYYALANDVENIKREQGTGSTMIHVTKAAMEEREIPLPPLEEQKRIVAILDKADGIRRKRQQAIQLADDFLRSVFLEMFGDPISNPKKWRVVKLEQLVSDKKDIVDGPFGSSVNTKVDYVENGEIPVIRTKNVSPNGEFITDDLKFMTREKFDTVRRSEVLPGDVVLTKVGTIGNVMILPQSCKQAVLSTTGSCRIRLNQELIEPKYFFHFLKLYKPKMLQIAAEGVQPFLNMKHIKGFDVPLPEICVQKAFVKRCEQLEQIVALKKQALASKLPDSLTQKAFSGQL